MAQTGTKLTDKNKVDAMKKKDKLDSFIWPFGIVDDESFVGKLRWKKVTYNQETPKSWWGYSKIISEKKYLEQWDGEKWIKVHTVYDVIWLN